MGWCYNKCGLLGELSPGIVYCGGVGMQPVVVAPSILSADFTRLYDECTDVLSAGAEWLHVDVMDGLFVPNISIGVPVVKSLRKALPGAFLDVHLMIDRPVRYIDAFADAGADLLCCHVEADEPAGVEAALGRIRERGLQAALSVKPATPADAVAPYLPLCDMILVMTVEPGFGGQSFMADQMPKLAELRAMLDVFAPACRLEVDGGVSPATAGQVLSNGADTLVAGSAVFGAADRAAAIAAIRCGGAR